MTPSHTDFTSSTAWAADAAALLRVRPGISLEDVDTRSTPGYNGDKASAEEDLARGVGQLGDMQERLFAESQSHVADSSVLLVLQAMDTAGKGGIVKHVVGSMDPQGVHISGFKKPTPEELSHDFLWRIEKRVPQPGFVGVFDRSHYEDVLIGRVRQLAPPEEIERRYGAINDFEKRLADSGTRIVKVMLHISYEEQRSRLAERLERADKYWKYNPGDIDERALWPQYMRAYETVFERTDTDVAPWHVIPADRKWFSRLAVQALLINALADIDPQWPAAEFDVEEEKQRLAAT